MRAYIAALLLAVLATPAAADHGEVQRVDHELDGWTVGDFALLDHRGEPYTQQRLDGKWTFVVFGSTRCGDPCTSVLAALAGMRGRIAGTEAVNSMQVLFVSLDPEHDSAQALRRYLEPFGAGFAGASAAREPLARFVEDLSAPGAERRAGSLLFIGPNRELRGEFLPPYDVPLLTAAFLRTRARR
jgi:protein SCO1/2